MDLHHTPYNYDSKPTQPRELTDAELAEMDDATRERCDLVAYHALRNRGWHDHVADATETDITEIFEACEALVKWRNNGMHMDERPEAECFEAMMTLLERAEREYYRTLLEKEGVEE